MEVQLSMQNVIVNCLHDGTVNFSIFVTCKKANEKKTFQVSKNF